MAVTTISNDTARHFMDTVALTADTTLTAADSGKVFFLDATGEEILLPAVGVSAGVKYKFIVTAAVAVSSWTIVATTAKIYGQVVEAGLVQLAAAETTITLVHTSKATIGDWLTLESDGTNWYVAGQFAVAASFTTA